MATAQYQQSFININQSLNETNIITTLSATTSIGLMPGIYNCTSAIGVTLSYCNVPPDTLLGYGQTLQNTTSYDNSGSEIVIINSAPTGSVTVYGGIVGAPAGYPNQLISGAASFTVATQSSISIVGIGGTQATVWLKR